MTAPLLQALRLTWNQMGMTSMRSTLTIHAVFTRR